MNPIIQEISKQIQQGMKVLLDVVAEIFDSIDLATLKTMFLGPPLPRELPQCGFEEKIAPLPNSRSVEPVASAEPDNSSLDELPVLDESPVFLEKKNKRSKAEPVALSKQKKSPAKKKTKPLQSEKTRKSKDKTILPERVRLLKETDAVEGSTYLARIIWTLGLAEIEGLAPLCPSDIAAMILERTPVKLEPTNVARYFRSSKPKYITVAKKSGGSTYYRLDSEGQAIFLRDFLEA